VLLSGISALFSGHIQGFPPRSGTAAVPVRLAAQFAAKVSALLRVGAGCPAHPLRWHTHSLGRLLPALGQPCATKQPLANPFRAHLSADKTFDAPNLTLAGVAIQISTPKEPQLKSSGAQ